MKRIATDELRHGQLAWDLHVWLLARLSRIEAERVEWARLQALEDLSRRPHHEQLDEPSRRRLGLPSRDVATQLASGLELALSQVA
jgi:hypothetical protein